MGMAKSEQGFQWDHYHFLLQNSSIQFYSKVWRGGCQVWPETELQKWGRERLMLVLLLWMDYDVQPAWAPFPGGRAPYSACPCPEC